MHERRLPVATILTAGLGLGLAGDFLLRAPGEPGLNGALLLAALAVSVAVVALRGDRNLSPEGWVLVAVGVLSAGGLLWRGSELLRFLAFVAAAGAFALVALHGGRAWVRRSGVTDLIEAVVAAGAHAVLGAVRLIRGGNPAVSGAKGSPAGGSTGQRIVRSALVGILLAAVPLVVFGALFISADPVFARMVQGLVRLDPETFLSHLAVAGILAWLASGYLAGFWFGTRLNRLREAAPARPSLGTAEVATALGLVNLLFLAFVVVQFRYLFGGAGWVEVTPGVTYAAYAREGFFQLVVATALGLPWLLAADGLLADREGPGRRTFRAFAGSQLALLLVIVASAVQRMRAYLEAYGLTEERFVATAVLVWLALLILWFGATVLRGRRARFAFGALVSAYVLVAALHLANPATYAARSHLDRYQGSTSPASGSEAFVDAAYLASLGSDAAPLLIGRLDELEEGDRCLVARGLLSRWGPDREWDRRSWNAADWRARKVVEAEAGRLRTMAGDGGSCG